MWLFRTTRPSPVTFEKFVAQAADISNATGAFADMGALTLTFTVAANSFLVFFFSASVSNSNIAQSVDRFKIQVDGVDVTGTFRSVTSIVAAGGTQTVSIAGASPVLTAGAHTVKVQWKNQLATLQCRPATQSETEGASLMALEMR